MPRRLLATALLGLLGCQALPFLIPVVLEFARNLLTTANRNQDAEYVQNLETLLLALVNRTEAQPAVQGRDAPDPLAVDVGLTAEIRGQTVPLRDGEVLRDAQEDKFRVLLRPERDCWVYVVIVDPTGWAQPLRVDGAYAAAGQQIGLPGGSGWYGLDKNKGVETLYVVAARERATEIERSLRYFAGQTRARSIPAATVSEPALVPGGFGERRSSPVRFRSGEQADAATYLARAGADLVVSRWFRHE